MTWEYNDDYKWDDDDTKQYTNPEIEMTNFIYKLQDYQHLKQYYKEMEPLEQQEVEDFEEFDIDELENQIKNYEEPHIEDYDNISDCDLHGVFVLARTFKEKVSLLNIQSRLNSTKLIKRLIKHTNVLYISSEEQWKKKVKMMLCQTFSTITTKITKQHSP